MTEFKSWEEMSSREQLECMLWDLYKEVRGVRPRHIDFRSMTEADLLAMEAGLQEELALAEKARKEDQSRAVVRFSKRVEQVITAGAKDRETALRWIMEADQAGGDWDYLCFINGLPYGYFGKK